MSTEQNKALYRRFIQEIFNERRLDKLAEYVSPDYVLEDGPPGTPPGPAAIRQVVTIFGGAFPDLQIVLEEVIAEGDTVCARATTHGTHGGEFMGVAPTGKAVSVSGLTMVHIRDGRIAASWVHNDISGLMRQLGAVA